MLVEASTKKAAFLREALGAAALAGTVLDRQVQRASDVGEITDVRLISTRAMGGWERILPRMVPALGTHGELLVWCGEEMETVHRRQVWQRLRLEDRRPLPGRDRSWIWRFAANA